ncbi:MAG: hypothetical protein LPK85_09800 [Gammaproteobacteria bacterium]|nr:hypothetical protein [Gammaproteobacteria bacterium]
MLLQRSLRAQLLSLMAGGLILVLLIALACFRALSGGVGDYRALVEGTLRISSLVDAANVEFKVQVQEWKRFAT